MNKGNIYIIKLLKIWEILRDYSDEEHYLESTAILSKLADMGIPCDRRTLYRDIEILNTYGYEVLCESGNGTANKYCISTRRFSIPELRILMDAVQASCFITSKKTKELREKIAWLGGSFKAELLKTKTVEFNAVKSTNEDIFYSVNEISEAIERKKKISFKYFDYDMNHERVYRKDGRLYKVNPLATVYDNGKYYLLGYSPEHMPVAHYRIDRMEAVNMTDETIDVYHGSKIRLKRYKQPLFGMYQGETKSVELWIDESKLDPMFDAFGEDVVFTKDDAGLRFTIAVQISPMFFGWCASFGDKLKIVSPDDVKSEMAAYIQSIAKNYS